MSDELKKVEKELENIKTKVPNYPQEKEIIDEAKDLHNTILNFIEEGKSLGMTEAEAEKSFVTDKLKNYGITKQSIEKYFELREKAVKGNYALADGIDYFSKIFDEIRIYVIEQLPKTGKVNYPLLEYIKTRYWQNGNTSNWYPDDTTPVVFIKPEQTINTRMYDFNGTNAQPFVEVFDTPLIVRKSMDMLNVYLNDFVRSSALFVTLVNNRYLIFTREEERLYFQIARRLVTGTFKYEMISNFDNPQNNLAPVDYSTYTPDFIISETSYINGWKALSNFLIFLRAPRRRGPNPDYIPNGSSIYLERNVNTDKGVLIMPYQVFARIQFNVLSSLYNKEQLNLPTRIVVMDYQGNFEENRGINNLKYTENEADIFYYNPDTYEIGMHYDTEVSINTPVLKNVVNRFMKMGVSMDKREYSYKIRFKISTIIETNVDSINVFKGTDGTISITNYDDLVADNGTVKVSFTGIKGTATLDATTKTIKVSSTNDTLFSENAEIVITSSKSDVEKRIAVKLYNTQTTITQADVTYSATDEDYKTITITDFLKVQDIKIDWDKKWLVDVKYFTVSNDGRIKIRSQGSSGVITFTISSPNLTAPTTFKVTLT